MKSQKKPIIIGKNDINEYNSNSRESINIDLNSIMNQNSMRS